MTQIVSKTISFVAVILLNISFILFVSFPAKAANGANFDPGYIISDEIFFDSGSMNSIQISDFLNSKVPNCRTGYVCLKDYQQATPTITDPLQRCSTYQGSTRESASKIIEKVASACGISPKVLIVLLEKEQSLVTDTWPLTSQYNNATGFACPDTAPCDPAFSGFFYQVYYAARQFKTYAMFPSSYNYAPGRVNTILFHPNRSCSSSQVYILNQATANLYIYTPYQPNAAALANLYGTGDSCSAYGNRNFWRIFTDWFGSTTDNFQGAISAKHLSVGGNNGLLGSPTTSYIYESGGGGGWVRGFSNGIITYKRSTGAVILRGDFRNHFVNTGRYGGSLGWPVSDQLIIQENGSGIYQTFEKGSIALPQGQTQIVTVADGFRELYRQSSGPRGQLGWPLSEVRNIPGGTAQSFQGGLMVRNSLLATSLVDINFAAYFEEFGSITYFGMPTSGKVMFSQNGGGVAQAFRNATLVKQANQSVYQLSGQVLAEYRVQGGILGRLGWPTSQEVCGGNQLCFQTFEQGRIDCSNGTCSTTVSSPVFQGSNEISLFANSNSAQLGNSISGVIPQLRPPTGAAQAFQNGTVLWNPQFGSVAVLQPILGAYRTMGGLDGALGWPVSQNSQHVHGWVSQKFENGLLFANPNAVPFTVETIFSDSYLEQQGLSNLGRSTSGIISISQGYGQQYRKGTMLQGPGLQQYAVYGQILTRYRAAGGIAGSLGWPISIQTCSSENVCQQSFQGGTVIVGN